MVGAPAAASGAGQVFTFLGAAQSSLGTSGQTLFAQATNYGPAAANRRMDIYLDGALFNAVRYVVRNHVAAGGSQRLEAYRWSSYAATIGLAFADLKLAREELLEHFGRTPEEAVENFRDFCAIPVPRGHERWQPP